MLPHGARAHIAYGFPSCGLLLVLLLASGGCDDSVTVTFSAGCTDDCGDQPPPIAYGLSADRVSLPPELRQESADGAVIGEVPCGPEGMCPDPEDAEVSVSCTDEDLCDPAPKTLTLPVGGVIEFGRFSEELSSGNFFTEIHGVEVLEINYLIPSNTLTVGVPETELYWGPAGASTVDPEMGTRLFGTMPPVKARATPSGQVAIDPEGRQSLSDHLVAEEGLRRVRFFARTRADLNPGDPWPQGRLRVRVSMRVRVRGSRL